MLGRSQGLLRPGGLPSRHRTCPCSANQRRAELHTIIIS